MTNKDKKILDAFDTIHTDITNDMEMFHFHTASEKIYHYTWHTFADTILEESKDIFQKESQEEALSRKKLLLLIYTQILKTLHPFMPFITETIWGYIPHNTYKTKEQVIIERW